MTVDEVGRLTALVEWCEQATGPDRKLDALIWCALRGVRYSGHYEAYAGYGAHNAETQVEFTEPQKRSRLVSGNPRVPHAQPVTASLDAAMTLVPKGWGSKAQQLGHPTFWTLVEPGTGKEVTGLGATFALALTAAALRARSATTQGREM